MANLADFGPILSENFWGPPEWCIRARVHEKISVATLYKSYMNIHIILISLFKQKLHTGFWGFGVLSKSSASSNNLNTQNVVLAGKRVTDDKFLVESYQLSILNDVLYIFVRYRNRPIKMLDIVT